MAATRCITCVPGYSGLTARSSGFEGRCRRHSRLDLRVGTRKRSISIITTVQARHPGVPRLHAGRIQRIRVTAGAFFDEQTTRWDVSSFEDAATRDDGDGSWPALAMIGDVRPRARMPTPTCRSIPGSASSTTTPARPSRWPCSASLISISLPDRNCQLRCPLVRYRLQISKAPAAFPSAASTARNGCDSSVGRGRLRRHQPHLGQQCERPARGPGTGHTGSVDEC